MEATVTRFAAGIFMVVVICVYMYTNCRNIVAKTFRGAQRNISCEVNSGPVDMRLNTLQPERSILSIGRGINMVKHRE